jgi:hypothetical protein
MPDWKHLVRKKLRVLGICSPEFTEELAAHLEDGYEALRREGLPSDVAFQKTKRQIEGRRRLWLGMRLLQEELMTDFIRKVALPGILTSAAACFFYRVLALDNIRPRLIWLVGGQLPLWWWCLLPLCGAVGALLSHPNDGSPLHRVSASLLPSAVLGAVVVMIFVAGFAISGLVNHYQLASVRLESLGIVPPGFVLIPAAFSLLGAGIAEVSTRKFRHLS